MPRLPGICKECGAIYPAPLRADDATSDPAFEIPAPCPVCGGTGAVPSEVLARLTSLLATGERLRGDGAAVGRLVDALEDASVPMDGDEEVRTVARARLRARAAELADGGEGLVDALFGMERGWLHAAGRLLRLAARTGEEEPGRETATSVEDLLEQAYRRWGPANGGEAGGTGGEPGEPGASGAARRRLAAAGRNDPCPCGSGEKYKECHWLADLRVTR